MITVKKIAFIAAVLASTICHAQIDTIKLHNKELNTALLKPGLNQYLVYFQVPSKNKSLGFWFWLRDIKKESRNGESVFTITQHWFGSDTNAYRFVYSVNRASDFAPVYHKEAAGNKINAYNWGEKKITGADTVAQNSRKAFNLDFNEPNYNWNLDIETFEMLPLAAGKAFAINFYDAGLDPPGYVIYKVIGDEIISTSAGKQVDCWKLYTENKAGHYSETYWISKKEHEFLKEEDTFNGNYRYKIKLPNFSSDILSKFKQ